MTDQLLPQAPRALTPIEALQILDAATTPAYIAKLNRADFANVQVALEVIAKVLQPAKSTVPKPVEGDEPVAPWRNGTPHE